MKEKRIATRYIKTVIFNSVNEISCIDEKVNKEIEKLKGNEAKIISITSNVFGLSPMNLIYNIIYEAENKIE